MKRILVTGASGFVGRALCHALLKKGYEVTAVGRHDPVISGVDFFESDLSKGTIPANLFRGVHGVVHLMGESISGRWWRKKRKQIISSRLKSTRNLVESLHGASHKPKVLVCASATGYYGDKKDKDLDESSRSGRDFLSYVCREWEKEATKASELGLRVVNMRTAPVLGGGGMLAQMLPTFLLGLGAEFGGGQQWAPWVHVDDLVAAYVFALESGGLDGPVNASGPQQVTHHQFVTAFGDAIGRRIHFRLPMFLVRLLFGKMSNLFLFSQKIYPAKLLEAGFVFKYERMGPAMKAAVKQLKTKAIRS